MPSIDERVVEMKFKDDQFRRGISGTSKALGDLKKGLDMKGAAKGLQEIDKAGKGIKLDSIANGIQGLQSKFSALSIAGITALTNIANRAVDTGVSLVKSLTIDPIKMGLEEYETQLNSVQTILANTAHQGTNLKDVNGALNELNEYADKTIYNFTEMSRNIGTFTAAGVDLDTSTEAIKGIANLAAVSGSNSQQASTAMYQLSQALSTGKVSLMDWNSVVNAGMGGKVFQDALIETAKVQGIAVDDMIKKEGSFRDSLTKHGWLTSEVLTETLAKFTGDLSAEQLKQQGYNDQQIKDILKLGQTANDAATKVKTMTQLIDTLKESAQSGWTESWQHIFGDFEEAKELFTGVNNVLGDMIGSSADARNKMLKDWKDMGGRDLAIQAIGDAFKLLMSVIKPVKDAFRDIFPATTGKDLYNFTKAIADFVKSLTLGGDAAKNLQRTFRGVFAVLDIGWMVIKGVVGVIGDLIGAIFEGSGGVLEFTGNIGDWLVSLRDAIKNGEGLTKFFDGLSVVLRKPIEWLKALGRALGELFGGGFSSDKLVGEFKPIEAISNVLQGLFKGLWGLIKGVAAIFGPFVEKAIAFASDFFGTLVGAMGELDFSHVLDMINTGLFAGLVLLFKNFLGGGWLDQIKSAFGGGDGGGLVDTIKEVFGGVTDTLSAMQQNLKAGTLIKIAGALALLTASVVALSMIDAGALAKALTAMSLMFTQLVVVMVVLEKFATGPGFLKMPFVAASLILLSAAIGILSIAVGNLGKNDWDELAKGLVGVGGLLASLNLFLAFAKVQKGAIANGAGLILLGVAINILATAVGKFANMSWTDLAKGVATLTALLGVLGLFGALTNKLGGMSGGGGLILMAVALNLLIKPLKEMGQMKWSEIAKGLTMLAGSLLILGVAGALMTGTLAGSAAMMVMAVALRVLQPALEAFGEMEWQEIGKAMTMLAGSLLLLAAAGIVMNAALPGAAAMIVMAGALAIMAPPLALLGTMSWDAILRGLVMLAGALTVLGVAGILILPAIPGLILLGTAITLIGVGTLAAATGISLLTAALLAFTAAGGAAVAVMVAAVRAILELLPYAMSQFGLAVVAFIQAIADNTTAIIAAFVKIGLGILGAIRTMTPEIVATVWDLIWAMVSEFHKNVYRFTNAALDIMLKFMIALDAKIPLLSDKGADLIITFLEGIDNNMGRVTDKAADTVVKFVNSVASAIENHSESMRSAGGRLAMAIADGMTGGLASKAASVAQSAWNLGKKAIAGIKGAIDSNSPSKESMYLGEFVGDGLAVGMDHRTTKVGRSAGSLGNAALDSIKTSMLAVSDILENDMDVTPVITPVLDTTGLRRGASAIGGMFNAGINTYGQANDISSDFDEVIGRPPGPEEGGDSYTFNQYNSSPKALTTGEIYRNTHNQISQAQKA